MIRKGHVSYTTVHNILKTEHHYAYQKGDTTLAFDYMSDIDSSYISRPISYKKIIIGMWKPIWMQLCLISHVIPTLESNPKPDIERQGNNQSLLQNRASSRTRLLR